MLRGGAAGAATGAAAATGNCVTLTGAGSDDGASSSGRLRSNASASEGVCAGVLAAFAAVVTDPAFAADTTGAAGRAAAPVEAEPGETMVDAAACATVDAAGDAVCATPMDTAAGADCRADAMPMLVSSRAPAAAASFGGAAGAAGFAGGGSKFRSPPLTDGKARKRCVCETGAAGCTSGVNSNSRMSSTACGVSTGGVAARAGAGAGAADNFGGGCGAAFAAGAAIAGASLTSGASSMTFSDSV